MKQDTFPIIPPISFPFIKIRIVMITSMSEVSIVFSQNNYVAYLVTSTK